MTGPFQAVSEEKIGFSQHFKGKFSQLSRYFGQNSQYFPQGSQFPFLFLYDGSKATEVTGPSVFDFISLYVKDLDELEVE